MIALYFKVNEVYTTLKISLFIIYSVLNIESEMIISTDNHLLFIKERKKSLF